MGGALAFGGTSRFEIERALGAGGMGVVYLAWDRERRMRVALKTLADADPGNLARLKNEFRALAGIEHPNLVGLYELFADEGRWFFTMEAIDGARFDAFAAAIPRIGEADLLITTRVQARDRTRDLRTRADEAAHGEAANDARVGRPVADLDRLRTAVRGLVDGIAALHAAGKVHCDLKPSNVLVTPEGRVVVLDFGLVKERPRDPESLSASLEGTPEYVAPEVVRGLAPTFASDWYQVGVMLFQAISGRPPFREGHFTATLLRKLEHDAPRLSSIVDGVPPALDDLVAALLARDPEQRASGAAIRSWLDGEERGHASERDVAEPAFVGRVREQVELASSFERAARGEPSLVIVRGPSGIGKTALVRRFAEELEASGRALVLSSRCYEREEVPFKALDGVVDALAARLARMPGSKVAAIVPPDAASLAVLFPVLRAVDTIAELPPPDASLDPSEVVARAADAARTILTRLAEEQPIVIAIDDLQWGDADSAALVARVIEPGSSLRVLLVASTRSTSDEPLVIRAFASAMRARTEIEIGPLAPEESAALATSVLGDAARAQAIAADAGGVPFFVTELARHAVRAPGDAIASGVDDVVAARVAALPDEARALLEHAAVAGVPIAPATLARAAGLATDPMPSLRLLGARSLVRTDARGRSEIEPYHDRIREVVATRLGEARRTAVHAALGDALAREPDVDPETVADHLARGGDRARALPFQIRAAERASRALAFDRAASLRKQAVALCDREEDRREQRVAWADALVLAGRAAEAAPLYLERAAQATDARERALFERRAAEEWLKCGRIDDGVQALRGVLTRVGLRYPDAPAEALARAVVRILRIRRVKGTFSEAPEATIRPEVLARVDAARAAGVGLMMVDPLRGYGFLARFLLDAMSAGEPRRISAALSLNAVTLCRGGEAGYPQAKMWLDRAREIGDRLDDEYLRGLADACEAGASVCTGRWAEGARFGLAAPARLRAQGTPATWESTAAGSLARTSLLYAGDLATLRPLTARQLRAAEDVGDLFAATYARVHGWFAAAMDDDVARGRAEQADALDRWSQLGFHAMHFWSLYGELQYDLYEGAAARGLERLAKRRKELSRSRILAMQFYRAFLVATEANLELARAQESRDERAARLAKCDALAKQLLGEGRPYTDALGSFVKGRIAMARGHSADAAAAMDRALEGFGVAGMSLYRAAALAQRGVIVRGADGRAAIAQAEATVRAQGVKDPVRWLAMLGVARD